MRFTILLYNCTTNPASYLNQHLNFQSLTSVQQELFHLREIHLETYSLQQQQDRREMRHVESMVYY